MLEIIQPVRYLIKIFLRDDSPSQLALGVALGAMIGLIPKGNLVVVCLTFIMFAVRVNLGTSLFMIFSLTAVSGWIDPLSHAIGHRILSDPTRADWLSRFFETPLMPWTSLNNTVVLGGFVLGSCMFYPWFHISERIFSRYYSQAKFYATYWKHRKAKSIPVDTPTPTGDSVPVDWRHA